MTFIQVQWYIYNTNAEKLRHKLINNIYFIVTYLLLSWKKTCLNLFLFSSYFNGINNLSDGVSSGAQDKCGSRHSIFKRQFRSDLCNIPFLSSVPRTSVLKTYHFLYILVPTYIICLGWIFHLFICVRHV